MAKLPSGKFTKNRFFERVDELAAWIAATDANGLTAYHACAAYNDAAGVWNAHKKKQEFRCQANVSAIRAFWLELDYGPGHAKPGPYRTFNETVAAVAAFCRAATLPAPLLVSSGGGLHCYWPLVDSLDAETWKSFATGLRSLCRRENLAIDPARACDTASILRTPGTLNRKYDPPAQVQMGPLVGPYPISAFAHLLNEQDQNGHSQHHVASSIQSTSFGTIEGDATHLNRAKPEHFAIRFEVGTREPRYSERIADGCGAVGRFRRELGCIPEPLWYANLGVLAFADDGFEYAHAWSSGYPGYSEQETSAKFEQARTHQTGATTCAQFHRLDPATCEACPHWQSIKSPISLGYDQADEAGGSEAGAAFTTSMGDNVGLPALPKHFKWENQSLTFISDYTDGRPNTVLISSYPIFLSGVNEGEIRKEFSLTFKQWLPAKQWFDITISAKALAQPLGMAELAKHGTNIHEPVHFMRYVRAAVDQFYQAGKLKTQYDQYGWKQNDQSFLFGRTLYAAAGETEIAGSEELQTRNKWLGPGCNAKGDEACSLDAWTQHANSLFAAGCEAQSVALLASFAAPLMRFMASDEGGAIVSLVTRASATGKTTALAAIASVWGAREGLSLTNTDTKVSKGLTLGALGNLPIIYDEIETRDPVVIRDFVIDFTNGRDKMRATREGQIRHSAATWQTLMVTASNTSLVDTLSIGSKADAPAYRIIELKLELPDHLKHMFGDKLKNDLIASAGFAGDAYLRYIVQPSVRAWLQPALQQAMEQLWQTTKLENKYRFWIRTLAAIQVAALIVRKLELLEFSVDRVMQWVIAELDARVNVEAGEREDWHALELSRFINKISKNILRVQHPWRHQMPAQKPLFEPKDEVLGRFEQKTNELVLSREAMRKYAVEHELPYREWITKLIRTDILTVMEKRTLTAGTDLPGGQVYTAKVNLKHQAMSGIRDEAKEGPVVRLADFHRKQN